MKNLCMLICLLFIIGCDGYSKDASNTLNNIQNKQILNIGVIEHAPWAWNDNSIPRGIEVELVKEFAHSLGVNTHWTFLPEADAVKKLNEQDVDLVIGGLTLDNPRKKKLGFTRPYLEIGGDKKGLHVMAVQQGENRFITTLEKFLKGHKRTIEKMYQERQP